ncbi:MAG TPA: cobalamin-binding protein [Dehalococcoidia bacterium]|nr:cobalamin-binding protein [Dehalococcoidia bacterium]
MFSIKKKLVIFGGLLLALELVVMTVLSTPSLATTYPITVTDDLGREVTIEALPERIISLAPSNTEILFALGLEDRVVGVTDFCDYPAEALEKEKVGGPWTPNIEKIVALEPDFILAEEINPIDVIDTLEGLGLTVFGIESTDLDDLLNDINTVGIVTDKESEAEALIDDMQSKIDAVTAETGGLVPGEKPGVFHILWHDPIYTSGQGTFVYDLLEKAGGVNIFGDLEGWPTVSLEAVITRDPEVIIVTAMGGTASGTWEWVNTESRLEDVSARQNGRVYFAESNWLERPGPRIVLGLEQIAKYIHPDIFFDPWDYDEDKNGEISKDEAIGGIQDYFNGLMAKAQAIQVVMLYF